MARIIFVIRRCNGINNLQFLDHHSNFKSYVIKPCLFAYHFHYDSTYIVATFSGWSAEDHAVLSGHSTLASHLTPTTEEPVLPKFRERSVDVPEVPPLPQRHNMILETAEERQSDTEMEMDSPRSLPDMPPPLKPPRSWDLIQAGLTMPKGVRLLNLATLR